MKKTLELLKEYGNIEAQAVNNFLRLSFVASQKGWKGLQQHFLSEGREDMEHSTMIVEFLTDYGVDFEPIGAELDEKAPTVKEYKDFLEYFIWKENGAAKFVTGCYESAKEEGCEQKVVDFAGKFIDIHVEEENEANELMAKYEELGQEEFDNWLFNKYNK